MDIQAQRERLNSVIRERAIRYGDFVLRSGAHSSFYLDCRQVTLDSEGAFLVASLMLAKMRGMDAQAVGGPALGALNLYVKAPSLPVAGQPCSAYRFASRSRVLLSVTRSAMPSTTRSMPVRDIEITQLAFPARFWLLRVPAPLTK